MPRKNDTRYQILLSSLQLFAQYGYSSVSMRQIAQKVGIQTGSIYTHFASKEQILQSLVDMFSENVGRHNPTREEIRSLCEKATARQVILRFAYDFEPGDALMDITFLRLVYQEQYNNSILQNWMMDMYNKQTDTLEYALQQLHLLGKIPPAPQGFHTVAAMLERALEMIGVEATMFPSEGERLAEEKRELFECFIHFVSGEPRSSLTT